MSIETPNTRDPFGATPTIRFIADDFGMSEEVNEAILHAHLEGALHGTALMMGMPGTAAAVELARAHPSLEVGWHLHLNDSLPMTRDAWPWGRSPARAGVAMGFSPRVRAFVRREIETQWTAYRQTGLPCRFVNSHHHLHIHPFVRRNLARNVPPDFGGWLRWGEPRFFNPSFSRLVYAALHRGLQAAPRRRSPYPLSRTLWGIDRTFKMSAREVAAVLPRLGPGLHEFIFHPRRHGPGADPDTRCLLELAALPEVVALTGAHRAPSSPSGLTTSQSSSSSSSKRDGSISGSIS